MALPFAPNAETMPLNVLFPEAYESTKRMIVYDFLTYGALIVAGVVGFVYLHG